MKHRATFLAAASLTCLLASCTTTSVTVTTNSDPAANFGKYRTYALAPPKSGQAMAPVSEAALRDALRAELAKHGLTEGTGRQADLNIVRHAFIQGKLSVQQFSDWGYGYQGGWPYGFGHYGMWAGAPITYTDVSVYDEGTLILDFVDARTKKLVFRGTGNAVVSGPETNSEKIREAVAKIVAAYPGKAAP